MNLTLAGCRERPLSPWSQKKMKQLRAVQTWQQAALCCSVACWYVSYLSFAPALSVVPLPAGLTDEASVTGPVTHFHCSPSQASSDQLQRNNIPTVWRSHKDKETDLYESTSWNHWCQLFLIMINRFSHISSKRMSNICWLQLLKCKKLKEMKGSFGFGLLAW